jgi:hypothetical protein
MTLASCVALLSTHGISQQFYPLAFGNTWMYDVWTYRSPGWNHELRHIAVNSDSNTILGARYSALSAEDPFGGMIVREDSTGVFYMGLYLEEMYDEYVFNTIDTIGHAYNVHWRTLFSAVVQNAGIVTALGEQRVVRSFLFDGLTTESVSLAKGLGISRRDDYGDGAVFRGLPWNTWILRSCIIGDTLHGQGIGSAAPVDTMALWGTCTPPGFICHMNTPDPRVDRISVLCRDGIILLGPPFSGASAIDSTYFDVLDAGTPNTYTLSLTWFDWYGYSDTIRSVLPLDSTIFLSPGSLTITLKAFESGIQIDSLSMPFAVYQTGLAVEPDASQLLPRDMLLQNFPNPFNPATTITYQIGSAGYVKLAVYDVMGRQVAILVDGPAQAGTHRARWDAARFSTGVYVCRLQVQPSTSASPAASRGGAGSIHTQKLVLMR